MKLLSVSFYFPSGSGSTQHSAFSLKNKNQEIKQQKEHGSLHLQPKVRLPQPGQAQVRESV